MGVQCTLFKFFFRGIIITCQIWLVWTWYLVPRKSDRLNCPNYLQKACGTSVVVVGDTEKVTNISNVRVFEYCGFWVLRFLSTAAWKDQGLYFEINEIIKHWQFAYISFLNCYFAFIIPFSLASIGLSRNMLHPVVCVQ